MNINNLEWSEISRDSFIYGELESYLTSNPGWRLPTLAELINLVNYDLYVAKIFTYPHWLWTSDIYHQKNVKTGYAVYTKPDGLVHEVTAAFGHAYAMLVKESA
jgi:hypothetical protein